MSTLIVTLPLPGTASTEYDYVLSPDGQSITTAARAAAALLPRPAGAGAEVVAVLPARALSWHRVELPKGLSPASPRLRAVLEGLLEDRLLDEPATLHFALQPAAHAGAPLWVAACDRAWLRAGVQALEAAGRPVGRIVPELWPAAPDEPAALYVSGEPERAVLTLVDAEGVVAWPAGGDALVPADDELPVLAEPAVTAFAEQSLQRRVTLQQASQRQLQAARSAWDLAQFDLASSGRTRLLKKLSTGLAGLLHGPQWRAARWGAAVLVLANLAGLNAWAWMERNALAAKRDQVRAALTGTFPSVRVVVDAPVQMEREVAALRQATGAASGADMESMLAALAATAAPGRGPSALEFAGGELRLRGLEGATAPAGYTARTEGNTLVVRQGPSQGQNQGVTP